jgi:transposase
MARKFKTVDYAESLQQTVTLGDCLSPDHLVRFIVGVIGLLDVSSFYARYAPIGGEAFAPEVLLGLLLFGYATGVFSSRKLETATYESLPFRFVAGGLHPDHSTIAEFRKTFLTEITELFVQVLVLAHEAGWLNLGNISLDGSKIHADASKSQAVSYGRLLELQDTLRAEVAELLARSEQADQQALPDGLNVVEEILLRQGRLTHLEQAQTILEARAKERAAHEQAEYEAKVRARAVKAQAPGSRARPARAGSPCDRSIQLHRPRLAHYEE